MKRLSLLACTGLLLSGCATFQPVETVQAQLLDLIRATTVA